MERGRSVMPSILTLTMNPSIDKSANVDHVVAERKLRCWSVRYEAGGGGINVSRAIRELGGESVALYPAGDSYGQLLRDLLDREGIDHRAIRIEERTRENLTVYEEATGQQFRFGMPGPTLEDKEWNRCLSAMVEIDPRPDYLVASGTLPPGVPEEFYALVARLARDIGAKLIVDTSGEALCLAMREGPFLVKPNLREFKELVGQEIKDESHQADLAMQMVSAGQSEVVVISLGAAGAMVASKGRCEYLRAPIVPIKSKVGAGDSMVAGIVLSLARGLSLGEAVRFGVAAGAAAAMTPGTELCRREDVERLYERMISGEAQPPH